ncbi:TetR/AcrR family transcriptional regulator [Actibacterium sp. 188UL27-1]|uniref:TetR/AcrR family transcriptional regulator n=1 Tax=Actibacterium sp. 188UL27-1 TaxID=2786961 RepID=UPI00195D7355|nr:TetR/AcrR family transcriptional regulator [Actibacterium sp. 188UL27-1]MBM7069435.1 TetR/AcrR family transcriptional regulator [Actibacterium sp. 188UL27-1]
MRQENKDKREAQIAEAAYKLLEHKGFSNVSMLMIARAAKASNETLYRWYGDKHGLFLALVRRNTDEVRHVLQDVPLEDGLAANLSRIGPVLLGMLLGARAVALNRAAAADPSGDLGRALALAGRDVVAPLLADLMTGLSDRMDPVAATELYLSLLIGDQQIRRVIGVMPLPDPPALQARADAALDHFMDLVRF